MTNAIEIALNTVYNIIPSDYTHSAINPTIEVHGGTVNVYTSIRTDVEHTDETNMVLSMVMVEGSQPLVGTPRYIYITSVSGTPEVFADFINS